MKYRSQFASVFVLFMLMSSHSAQAIEMEPRRWNHLPINTNFSGVGYGFTSAEIFFDPVLQVEDATMELHSVIAKYIRTFEMLGKSARIGLIQAFQTGQWSGLLEGVPTSVRRTGLSDTFVRFAINLFGAPPLEGKDYAAYRAKKTSETIVGLAVLVHLPTGDYLPEKLINLGSNRFTFRTQLGIEHKEGPWSFELTGAVWLYTDNNKFFDGNRLEQKPFYSLQSHVIYSLKPGLWLQTGLGYGYGGQAQINDIKKDNKRSDLAWSASFGFPLTRKVSIKIAYLGIRTQNGVGFNSNTGSLSFSTYW
jgi:hypothetical protein